jgi:DNA-directed RNA polymerase specialized sigma24 family protein
VATTTIRENTLRREFLALLPELKRRLRLTFRRLRAEARAECVTEGIAIAFAMWLSARRRHRPVNIISLSRYTIAAVRSGRKLAGTSSTDVLSECARCKGRVPTVYYLGTGNLLLEGRHLDPILRDRWSHWPVPDRVAFKLDFRDYVSQQSRRPRQIIDLLAQGYRRSEAATMLGVSSAAVTQRMDRAWQAWQAHIDGVSHVHGPECARGLPRAA